MATQVIQIKRSTSNAVPSSLQTGELSVGFNNFDNHLSIGSPSGPQPINAFNVYSTTTNFSILNFNSFTTGSGLITITLPKTTSFNIGQMCIIRNIGGVSIITINAASGDTINGSASTTIAINSVSRLIVSSVGVIYSF